MTYFLLNLCLAMAWMLLNGNYSSSHFFIGFIIGFVVLRLAQPFGVHASYFKRCKALLSLISYFSYEMVVSVARVTWDVLTPTHLSEPRIVYVPLDVSSDLEITLLSNMVSLTPGSLCLDITPDRRFLILHVMFAGKKQTVIDEIKHGLEQRILEVTRG
ncbi:Na+/H+ antiporter subunit E [Motilimonas sp. KMU-193]|uniref:Na+/H+ antiporter subunit E n=1 Tax=Motilimonas sp. KMU-193 TaxID=3388668 RepID=UPI00396B45E0